jgi:hypothetical protein
MKYLVSIHYFLGIDVWKSLEKIFLNQRKYAVEILKIFDMLECKYMNTPMETNLKLRVDTSSDLVDATLYKQIVRSLMYLMNTRPDICFVVNTLSRYLVEPRRVHLIAAKHVMIYLKGTLDYGLCYTEIMNLYYVVILIQIGLEVLQTGTTLHVVILVWV